MIVPLFHVPVVGAKGVERGCRCRPRVSPPLTSTTAFPVGATPMPALPINSSTALATTVCVGSRGTAAGAAEFTKVCSPMVLMAILAVAAAPLLPTVLTRSSAAIQLSMMWMISGFANDLDARGARFVARAVGRAVVHDEHK